MKTILVKIESDNRRQPDKLVLDTILSKIGQAIRKRDEYEGLVVLPSGIYFYEIVDKDDYDGRA